MPLLQTKIEGKGNGIKTVVPNMSDVARALSRPPTCKLLPISAAVDLIDFRSNKILRV